MGEWLVHGSFPQRAGGNFGAIPPAGDGSAGQNWQRASTPKVGAARGVKDNLPVTPGAKGG